jgi:thioredoxin reductase
MVAVIDLATQLPWLAASVRDIRMLRIEELNDLIPVVQRVVGLPGAPRMPESLSCQGGRGMAKVGPLRIAVIGAGPIGLEAALYARLNGYPVAIYDWGGIAEHIRRWGHVRLFTPFGLNVTSHGLRTILQEKPSRDLPTESDTITGRDFREAYLVPLGESELLLESLNLEHNVLHIGRVNNIKKSEPDDSPRPFRLLVRDMKGQERIDIADIVLDCSGTYGTPKWLGDGNIPAVGESAARPQIACGLEDILGERKGFYAGRTIALIGNGYSAASTMCGLAALAEEHPATWVFWLSRGPRGQPLPRFPNDPFRERDRLAAKANSLATRCEGNLEFQTQTVLDEVTCHGAEKGFRIAGRSNCKPVSWEVERVIGNVGYRPDRRISAGLRVDEPMGSIETREPGYFILGAKSWGHESGFLLRDGFEQIKQAFATIAGNSRLDLYGKKAA